MGRSKIILLAVVVLAFLLRFVSLSSFPSGFSADEVNQGYTAYSILKTGKDEWGEVLPIAPRSYGDYRAPLYTYLTIPSIFLFGLNEFAVRLPNVLLGTLSIPVVYFLVRELFKNNSLKIDNRKLGIAASFLLAVSPWHIMLSRGAFEPNLPTFLFPLGILLFIKGIKNSGFMVLSAIVFGLSLFCYYSARMLVPAVLVILYMLYLRRQNIVSVFKSNIAAVLIFSIFLAVAVYTMFFGASTRVLDVAIFSSKDVLANIADHKYQAVILGLPDMAARMFSNKFVGVLELFTKNYLGYYSLDFLFLEGASEATYGMLPGIGLLYIVELLFILVAVGIILHSKLYKNEGVILALALIALAPIPAALTTGNGFAANRAAIMLPWITILSAFGGLWLIRQFKYLKYVFLGYFLIALIFFLESYFFHAPATNSKYMSYGWKQASEYLQLVNEQYETIVVSRSFSEPQMFISFYLELDPEIVHRDSADWLRYEKQGLKFVDQLGEYRLGKYIFKSIDKSYDLNRLNSLIMGRPDDFPLHSQPDYIVRYPDGTDAIYFVSTTLEYAQKI